MGICGLITDSLLVLPAGMGFRSPPADSKLLLSSSSSSLFPLLSRSSLFSYKSFFMFEFTRPGVRFEGSQLRIVRVRAMEGYGESQTPIAPLQFESPTGQLLSQIMVVEDLLRMPFIWSLGQHRSKYETSHLYDMEFESTSYLGLLELMVYV